ncbi:homocysteine S-methyltransferase [Planomonospora venezuelensis]|uniref:S-methylmethionine:homocysteine methyltransferase n=1 Tax=Planomonospora venezuelensis TaxID=1999 RepID=A0A841D081_PLAVE|nr:homocysteine S-methyltransferase [Planomonospora venezuelensis]MBB5961788.1 homocysteine S-methyltransferase [Planomonospora venezuelensis]GIM99524.1 homocysteine S-methyltransferase YbgG [Planomonospora venezuelensis]
MVILDGGLATRLEALGADLSDELWSAKLLVENPSLIRRAHLDYFAAGAQVATTASYQASIPAFRRRGLSLHEAEELIRFSVRLAAEARDDHGQGAVAASVGPYGAYLTGGAEYTGDYDLDEDGLVAWHRGRWNILASAGADFLACETIPSYAEARALKRLLGETPGVRAWVSFSCRDGEHISDGTPLRRAAELFSGDPQVLAVGVNCTAPRHLPSLIGQVKEKPVIVYPNSGEDWDAANRRWTGLADPVEFGAAAAGWHAAGAAFIGGCCRTTPEHIRRIREHLCGV